MYLSARKVEYGLNYLEFSANDIADPTVRNIIHTNSDGTIRIYSSHYGKFWRRSPNWIWGDERIGCSNLRGGGGELGANKKLDIWLQLFCTKLKLIQAI